MMEAQSSSETSALLRTDVSEESVRWLLVTANAPILPILITLIMEALRNVGSYKTHMV
jgi:hypothetical protein